MHDDRFFLTLRQQKFWETKLDPTRILVAILPNSVLVLSNQVLMFTLHK